MKRFLIVIVMLSGWVCVGQAPTKFYTRFGGNSVDISYGIKQTFDSQYIVAGTSSSFGYGNTDLYLAKIDSMGAPLWEKNFGGFNNDIGQQVVQLPDSGFVVVGYTNSFGYGGYDVLVVRTDKNGILVWQKSFGGTDWDYGYDMIVATDGNLIICGSTYSFGRGKLDGYFLKVNVTNGNLIWSHLYGGIEDDYFKGIKLTSDGKYLLAGSTKSYGDIAGDGWLFKTDMMGDSLFSNTYGGINKRDFFNDVIETPTGDYVFAGGSETYSSGMLDAFIMKCTNAGTTLWNANDGLATSDEIAFKIINSNSTACDYVFMFTSLEIFGTKKDLKRCLLGANGFYAPGGLTGTFGFAEDEEAFGLCNTKDKGFAMIGYTKSLGASDEDHFLVKFDSLGKFGVSMVGIEEQSPLNNTAEIKIYPNPVLNDCHISLSGIDPKEKITICLYNELGLKTFEKITTITESKSQILDFSGVRNGFYILSVESKSFSHKKTILKN